MDDNSVNTLALISSLINSNDTIDNDFYQNVLNEVSKVFSTDYLGIYFINQDGFELKAELGIYKCNLSLDRNFLDNVLKKDTNTFVITINNSNVLCSKLLIRNSLFGIGLAISENKFSDCDIKSFEALISVLSYLIKDYELKDVFKMQLKAMQEAIIDKNNALDTVKKQHKKLLELDKTKNSFLANISHELRTPLNAIIGFSQALSCKIFGDLNQKQEEYIKDIHISGLHLLGMINEILDLSKLESKAMKVSLSELSPSVVFQEAINILMPLSEQKKIEVKFINNCDKNIMADYQKLQQILFNLLSNAIKFTPENGKITIEISYKGKDFILKVSDTGIGIDKKYHNKIFTKFVHLNNLYIKGQSSTGLGLTITKELVKLHKGKITLESTVNKGTTFNVLLKDAIV